MFSSGTISSPNGKVKTGSDAKGGHVPFCTAENPVLWRGRWQASLPPRCTDSSDTAPLSSTQVTAAGVTEFGGGGVASAVTVCWDKVRAGLLKCRKDQVSATVNIKGVFVLSASFVSLPLICMSILDTSCMCKQFLDNIIRQFLTNCTFNICL